MPTSKSEQFRVKVEEIERELKRAGMWHAEPPPPEAFEFTRAFAGDTMAYSQWLQFVFLPRVHEILDGGGELPSSSSVGTQAVREFDGYDEAVDVVRVLGEFDAMIESR